MKKTLGLLLTLALVVSACGGSNSDPASAGTCEELADVGITLLQDALDSISGLGMDEVPDEMPEAFVKLDELDDRAAELGCTDEEGALLFCDRFDRLDADGEAAEFFLSTISADC